MVCLDCLLDVDDFISLFIADSASLYTFSMSSFMCRNRLHILIDEMTKVVPLLNYLHDRDLLRALTALNFGLEAQLRSSFGPTMNMMTSVNVVQIIIVYSRDYDLRSFSN